MVDALLANRGKADQSEILMRLGLEGSRYAVVTLHRPSNVDSEPVLVGIVNALVELATRIALAFPLHPRTRERLHEFGLLSKLEGDNRMLLTGPLGYLDFLKLTSESALILTDSGGLQEEACILHIPCLTLRGTTERPSTIEAGWNRLVGSRQDEILAAARAALEDPVG